MTDRMHRDEVPLDADKVRRLLSRQFPDWAELPITFVARGTVNAMFRLGAEMVIRLPFIELGTDGIHLEATWLPRLSHQLDFPIPQLLGVGEPDGEYPCPWLVLRWLPGTCPVPGDVKNPDRLAVELAGFLASLRKVDTTDAPIGYRAGPLHVLDVAVRECAERVRDVVDVGALLTIWEDSLAAPPWTSAPVWAHCDMLAGNVLVDDGRLTGVLDFAVAGVGDPACDLMAGWSLLPSPARGIFREALDVDDAMWSRGRGWALAQAMIALPYYRDTNPHMARTSLHILRELTR